MKIRAKTRTKSSTKVKRLSFHKYKEREAEKQGVTKLGGGPKSPKPAKKAVKKNPPHQNNQPKYSLPVPPPPNPPVPQPQVPVKPAGNVFLTIFIIIIVAFFVFTAIKIMNLDDLLDDDDGYDDGGRGVSGCPVSCQGQRAIIIAAQCSCPPGSRYRDTISGGMKQCLC